MGHRFSKTAVANFTTNADLYDKRNSSAISSTVSTTSSTRPTELREICSGNRIPIPLQGSTTINLQIQESPTTAETAAIAVTAAATTSNAIVASSSTQLSETDSGSLTSSGNSLQNRQIIIKIQLAKMENGNESQTTTHATTQQVGAETSSIALELERHNSETTTMGLATSSNSAQFVNLTLNGNFIYADDGNGSNEHTTTSVTMDGGRTAGGSTSINNNERNSELHLSLNALHIQEEWEEQQQSTDALPEYCEVLEESIGGSSTASNFQSTSESEPKKSDNSLTENVGCLNARRKSKTSLRSLSSSGLTKRRCREAFRRILEPSSAKSTSNKNKEQQKQQKHSEKLTTTTTATPPNQSSSIPPQQSDLPCTTTSNTVFSSSISGRTDSGNQSNNQIAQSVTVTATATNASTNLMPITISTVSDTTNSCSQNHQQTATASGTNPSISLSTVRGTTNPRAGVTRTIWASSQNDFVIPFTAPQQFLFVQCVPSSVVTLGPIDQNAIRIASADVSSVNGFVNNGIATTNLTKSILNGPIVHSQVDFVHCLVPDLDKIVNASFYWGKIDRYEAERLLEGKPEGTFLLRDSAQEEYLFSVTFRKYGRSLHARIEQNGHKFGFDCHDPGVFTASTVTGLLQHYKDPSCVMFFEPMLTIPLHRRTVFSLQELARAAIVSNTTYDGINKLGLPVRVKSFLKEYHYKQKLRVKPFDEPIYATCT